MTEDARVTIITPPIAESDMDLDLVNLTEFIAKTTGEEYVGGFLGGRFGYGTEFENDTFAMFPFYWGDCECGWDVIGAEIAEEPHDPDCYQVELDVRFREAGLGYDHETWQPRNPNLSYDEARSREQVIYDELTARYGLSKFGCAVHCTCTRPTRYQARFDTVKLGPEGHAESCPIIRPNFLHKPSGLRIDWYKWIGRDTETSRPVSPAEWRAIFAECVASVA